MKFIRVFWYSIKPKNHFIKMKHFIKFRKVNNSGLRVLFRLLLHLNYGTKSTLLLRKEDSKNMKKVLKIRIKVLFSVENAVKGF